MASTAELARRLGLEVVVDIVSPNDNNVPDEQLAELRFRYVHETANKNRGANAAFHRQFVADGGGADQVSFTWTIDSERAVQILPENSVNYAQGRAKANRNGDSFELCVNADGDWNRTLDNAAKLLAASLVSHGQDVNVLLQHWAVYGKNCPATIRATPGGWEALVAKVGQYRQMVLSGKHQHETLYVDIDAARAKPLSVKGEPTISPVVFRAVLAEKKSPVAGLADELYAICVSYYVDPAVALAFFGRESSYGTDPNGLFKRTNNWGNLVADVSLGRLAKRSATFAGHKFRAYDSVQDGLIDFCELWGADRYKGKPLAEQLKVYTEDDPAGYAKFVTDAARGWLERSGSFEYEGAV
jgi:hypothetical protein